MIFSNICSYFPLNHDLWGGIGRYLMHLLDLVTRVQVMHWGFFRKGCLRNESASPNFGEQNYPLPPPKKYWQQKDSDGALQKRNDVVLFCCPRGRGVSSRFVIFGCCSCFKKGFHFKCVGSTSSFPHEVYFTYLPMCGTPCYGKKKP